jgi:hypothetical protein
MALLRAERSAYYWGGKSRNDVDPLLSKEPLVCYIVVQLCLF